MTRTDLIALAERLPTLIDMLPPGIRATAGVDLCRIADFARQIAQAQPFVWYDDDTGETWTQEAIADGWGVPDMRPLYTLPLED